MFKNLTEDMEGIINKEGKKALVKLIEQKIHHRNSNYIKCKTERKHFFFQWKRAAVSRSWENFKQNNICVIGVSEEERA